MMRIWKIPALFALFFWSPAQSWEGVFQIPFERQCPNDLDPTMSQYEIASQKPNMPRPRYEPILSDSDSRAEYEWRYKSYSACVVEAMEETPSEEDQLFHLLLKHADAAKGPLSSTFLDIQSCTLSVSDRATIDPLKAIVENGVQHIPSEIVQVAEIEDGSLFMLECTAYEAPHGPSPFQLTPRRREVVGKENNEND